MSNEQVGNDQTDLSQLSVAELKNHQVYIQSLIESKKQEEVLGAYESITSILNSLGMTWDEMNAYIESSKKVKVKKKVEPRYRSQTNPNNTWTGRGKKPVWLVEELATGLTLDDLLIVK